MGTPEILVGAGYVLLMPPRNSSLSEKETDMVTLLQIEHEARRERMWVGYDDEGFDLMEWRTYHYVYGTDKDGWNYTREVKTSAEAETLMKSIKDAGMQIDPNAGWNCTPTYGTQSWIDGDSERAEIEREHEEWF